MITFKKVTMRNFMSIGQNTQSVNLAPSGLTLILGRNADIGTNAKNGVGKSLIGQAISYVLFGEALTKIKLDNLVNNINDKNMLVTIEFSRDSTDYRIERGRSPNVLRYYVDNQDITKDNEALGENKHTRTEIERVVGMTHLLFEHLVGLNTFTVPFLKLKAADQREVIEELLGITQLTLRDEVLKKKIVLSKESILVEDSQIKAHVEANNRIERAIARAVEERESWDIAQAIKITGLRRLIVESDIDFDAELLVFDLIDTWILNDREIRSAKGLYAAESEVLSKEMTGLKSEIMRCQGITQSDTQLSRLKSEKLRCEIEAGKSSDEQLGRLEKELTRRAKDAALKDNLISSKREELLVVQSELTNIDGHTCSTCGQGLVGTDHLAIVLRRLEAKVAALVLEIDGLVADSIRLRNEYAEIGLEIAQVEKSFVERKRDWLNKAEIVAKEISETLILQKSQQALVENKILELKERLNEIQDMLAVRSANLKEYDLALLEIGGRPVSDYGSREQLWKLRENRDRLMIDLEREIDKLNPFLQQIHALSATMQIIDYSVLNGLRITLTHQEFLHKLLSGKDSFVRKKIIDQNLLYLNGRMNKYLEEIGLMHEVRFLPDLSVEITLHGREFDFEQMSRGQMNRIILATCWAFRDVWESMNHSLNLVYLDEIIDNGTDEHGIENIMDVLMKMINLRNKNVFLISHKESLMGRVNRILMVHLENEFTRMEENAELVM